MEEVMAFHMLIERVDNALQNRGILKPRAKTAMSDWERFASQLRHSLFEEVVSSGIAPTLINKPPRKRLNQNGHPQWGKQPASLESAKDLLLKGVCQVRHNLVHGNKLEMNSRDSVLIEEASKVLELIIRDTRLFE